MRCTSLSVLSISSFFVFSIATASAQTSLEDMISDKPLSEEELTPFCNNKMIWDRFNISSEKCLAVSVPCTEEIAKKGMPIMQANTALYECAFKALGIVVPTE